jgi:hypothetical protein
MQDFTLQACKHFSHFVAAIDAWDLEIPVRNQREWVQRSDLLRVLPCRCDDPLRLLRLQQSHDPLVMLRVVKTKPFGINCSAHNAPFMRRILPSQSIASNSSTVEATTISVRTSHPVE